MSRLAQDGTAEPVSLDQILRRKRGTGKCIFPCSAGDEQGVFDVDPFSAESADPTYPDHTPSSSSTYARMPYHGITPPRI